MSPLVKASWYGNEKAIKIWLGIVGCKEVEKKGLGFIESLRAELSEKRQL